MAWRTFFRVITMKKYIFAVAAVLLCVTLCSCGGKNNSSGETLSADITLPAGEIPTAETSSERQTSQETIGESATDGTVTVNESEQPQPQPQPQTESGTQSAETKVSETAAPKTTAPAESTTKHELKKTGEMEFSDSPDNKYLAAVASKYSVDPSLLAAIYTVPDADGNLVLLFDGTKDASGRLVRTKDTLRAIYTVNKEMVSKCASEDESINEYPSGEMKVMYFSVTKYIMPEFETQLNG